ncbi:PREDICTED: protein kintoun [Elephantulus edwardii]|uniref:protein kintoun n=1 Tax=Elephantulus edwardii TaxID=28737 RepID=UPI0003F09B0C|nr:PREDICTED: protein kintoun [Elephantulus edwardii]
MAKATTSSKLEDLDLSGDEVKRLTSAFQDPEFRQLFAQYAEGLTDPENRRRYEAEIIALERERGVEVRFVHPEPGHVLRTSLDGARRCFVNVCSNELVGAPSSRPGCGGQAAGHHWSLPHSLAPGREYAGRQGTRYTVYDVVFHPEALALARRQERFRHMLNSTALEAVEKQFGVKLDRRNAKTLKIKYKGTPEAAVLRRPLPGGAPAQPEEEAGNPLPDFPYPYQYPAARGTSVVPQPHESSPTEAAPAPPPAPTEPRYSVVQRHHVDLQDYRCSRDSAPSTVPRELVVTIELPLLRSAEQAALEVTGKLLCLDSRKPDYRLRLSLPYPVDDSRGKAQFNKARRQLVVTLPVALSAARREPSAAPEVAADWAGTDGAACDPALRQEAGPTEGLRRDRGSSPGTSGAADTRIGPPSSPGVESSSAGAEENLVPQLEEQALGKHEGSPPPGPGSPAEDGGTDPCVLFGDPDSQSSPGGEGAGGELNVETHVAPEDTCWGPTDGVMDGLRTESAETLCPPLQCNQDEESLTLLIQVSRILPQSFQGDLSPCRYKLYFSTQDFVYYSALLQFAPENKLSTKEPVISISSNNAVIELAKSPESRGHWRQWYYGLNNDSLEEKLFVNEENVNELIEDALSSPLQQKISVAPPLIEVLQITDNNIQIHTKSQECPNSYQLDVKEGANDGRNHLTQNENTKHLITTTAEEENIEHLSTTVYEQEHNLGNARSSDSSLAVDSSGLVTCLQQKSVDVSQVLSGKSQQSESKMEPGFLKEKCAVNMNEEKHNFKEPVATGEKVLDRDHPSLLQNRTTAHHIPASESIKETNMQDGSVQILKDHVTHCAFSFQNSLLYDLD